jgi:hypothetical protein
MTENEEFEFRARREKERATPKEPTFGEKAGALAYGAATGFAGGLGELEKFGAYTVPEYLGFREPGERDKYKVMGVERETLFPTVKESEKVLSKLGIQPPREEVGGYQTAGEIAGGFGTALPGMIKGGAKALVGSTSAVGEQSAKALEKLGFKLSPSQVREFGPSGERGAKGFGEYNQRLANNLASQGTGESSNFITKEFIAGRLSKLGKEFDKLYKGKDFVVDFEARAALDAILSRETELGYAGVTPVKQIAQTMLDNLSSTSRVAGEDLQRLRNSLTERARSSTSRSDAHEIYNLVDIIDASVAKNNPALASSLNALRPKYRNSIILEDLYRANGIDRGDISLERLGNMLKSERSAVRRSPQDIDTLGRLGKENRLRAIWETEGKASTEATQALKEGLGTELGRFVGVPLRTRPARAVQRAVGGESGTRRVVRPGLATAPQTIAAGTAVRPLQPEEE